MGDRLPLEMGENVTTFDFTHFSLALAQVLPHEFSGITFDTNVDASLPASIELPSSLFDLLDVSNVTRIKNSVYRNKNLFLRRDEGSHVIASTIISASIVQQNVTDLESPIVMHFDIAYVSSCVCCVNIPIA